MPTDLLTHLFDIAHSIEGSVSLHIDHEGHRIRVYVSKVVNGTPQKLSWICPLEVLTAAHLTVALDMLHRRFLHQIVASPQQ